jgi:hypothetical protein
MNPQLERIEAEFIAAQARLHHLGRTVQPEKWLIRPAAGRWSIADCVDHLNRTSEAFVPLLREALQQAAAQRTPDPDQPSSQRYRRDPLGWALSVIMPPPVRWVRARTTEPFRPAPTETPAELIARFEQLQAEQIGCLRAADGLPLNSIRVRSPFNARARYNAYSCFVILPRHQHRHLWQAEQVAGALLAG